MGTLKLLTLESVFLGVIYFPDVFLGSEKYLEEEWKGFKVYLISDFP